MAEESGFRNNPTKTIKINEVNINAISDVEYTFSGWELREANLKKPVSIPYVRKIMAKAT